MNLDSDGRRPNRTGHGIARRTWNCDGYDDREDHETMKATNRIEELESALEAANAENAKLKAIIADEQQRANTAATLAANNAGEALTAQLRGARIANTEIAGLVEEFRFDWAPAREKDAKQFDADLDALARALSARPTEKDSDLIARIKAGGEQADELAIDALRFMVDSIVEPDRSRLSAEQLAEGDRLVARLRALAGDSEPKA